MRMRSRGSLTLMPAAIEQCIWTDCSKSSWYNVGSFAQPLVGESESMYDIVTPGFQRRKARGEVYFNPMSHFRESYTSGGGQGWYTRNNSVTCSSNGQHEVYKVDSDIYPAFACRRLNLAGSDRVPAVPVASNSDVSDMVAEATTACLSNIASGDANYWETIAEYRESLDIIHNSLSEANKILSGGLARKLKGATNAYLLARYGFRPLVGDIQAAIKHMRTQEHWDRRTARGFSSHSFQNTGSMTTQVGVYKVTSSIHDVDTVVVRAMSLDEFLVSRASELGINFKNLATLPWELIPYSFVADYFANVGDYLKAIMPTPGVRNLGSCVVIDRTVVSTYAATSTNYVGSSNFTSQRPIIGGFTSVFHSKTRGPLSQTPRVVIRSDFRFDDLFRVADLSALVAQRLFRRA